MAETRAAHARRMREGWYDRFAPTFLPGIDIGCGDDPLNATFRRWDIALGDGDATQLSGVPEGAFFTVYASHVLEHLADPLAALGEWYRVLMRGGHLIVCVPHRDLYEKRKHLPSRFNGEHKTFWLPERGEPPCTLGLRETLSAAAPEGQVVSVRVLDEGYLDPGTELHSQPEYSIEAIVQKP